LYVARVNENLDQSGTLRSYCVFQIACGDRRKQVGVLRGRKMKQRRIKEG
jgi:hypothetical protein